MSTHRGWVPGSWCGRLRVPPNLACTGALAGLVAWLASGLVTPLTTAPACVSLDPHLARLGLQLALLREDPNCPASQLAFAPSPLRGTGLVMILTLPTLLINLWSLATAVGLWMALRARVNRIVGAVRRWWPRLPRPVRVVPVARPVRRYATPAPVQPWQLRRSVVRRRGPPAVAAG